MALFELPIYDENDEIIKTHQTNKVRWGIFLQAVEVQEQLKGQSATKQFEQISAFMKKIFPALTDAELENADYNDVMNTFAQLSNKTGNIKTGTGEGDDEKN